MPATHARNVALTPQLAQFVDDLIAAGAYNNASEVVRDGLRELQRRKFLDQLTELRARIGVGLDQLDRGEGRTGDPTSVIGGILQEAKTRRRNT
ncbi:MAG: type II toxin-antitoxin system ParD family antitoxin [Deltaproteobacteria bacterium]|nr:type II toxin-antitoxin system ParD family antitoxin [Deltaproteobacteria bacterium]